MNKKEENILNELLTKWDELSKIVGIEWIACGGTLLGAYREKRRIKWDDDCDITIRKEDIKKLPIIFRYLKQKYNIDYSKFWGGYKIFFNKKTSKCINNFNGKYNWGWPFVDIFIIQDKSSFNCHKHLENYEKPIYTKFGNIRVKVPSVGFRSYNEIKKNNDKLFKEYYDYGYRHKTETQIPQKCKTRLI